MLPDFKAVTLDGKTVTRADYEGKQLAILCVATWGTCREHGVFASGEKTEKRQI